MKNIAFISIIALAFLTLSAQNNSEIISSLKANAEKYLGKPYRYQDSQTLTLLDCSGFICEVFKDFRDNLPHSSSELAKWVQRISYEKLEPGDLLFFKGRNLKSNSVGHVAMIYEINQDGEIQIIHSCSRGILIEKYPNTYYKPRYLFAGRLAKIAPPLPIDTQTSAIHLRDKQEIDSIKIVAVGDIMLGTNYPSEKFLPPANGAKLLEPYHHLFKSAQVSFANLEGVLLSENGTPKTCIDSSVCYLFKSPNPFIHNFVNAGINLLSLANNHTGDFGIEGRMNTIKLLQEYKIGFAGLSDYPTCVFEKDNVTYGFTAFSPNTGTLKMNDYETAKHYIAKLDSLCDIVIVSFHGGAEGAAHKHITRKTEEFIGENRGNPYEFARMAIDAGADLVLGHGPHVPRAVDLYKNKFIAYSLGNFATYARFNLNGSNGLAPLLEIYLSKKGDFISAKIHSAKQIKLGGPIPDLDHSAFKEIKALTIIDFPNTELDFFSDGTIRKKP
jgi:poly-gamma-glutamate capsule biosynthesis protein CapA/YwtB (metallophosphatase superfamily)